MLAQTFPFNTPGEYMHASTCSIGSDFHLLKLIYLLTHGSNGKRHLPSGCLELRIRLPGQRDVFTLVPSRDGLDQGFKPT